MKPTRYSKQILFSSLMLAGVFGAGAQSTEQVNTAIKEMFEEGNNRFIIVMGLQDGLIKEGQPYNVEYTPNKIKIAGKELEEPYQSRYMAMMRAFVQQVGEEKDDYYGERGDGFYLKDVLSRTSSLRKRNIQLWTVTKNKAAIQLAEALKTDGLVTDSERIYLSYNLTGLALNNKPLSPEMDAKYKRLIAEKVLFVPKGEKDNFLLTN